MKKLYGAIVVATVAGFANPVSAANKVNIVYPINGGSYPITDPAPGSLRSAYITASFGVTCTGGPWDVKWGFDTTTIGSTKIYDQMSEQQVWKLPGGSHVFWVNASKCGKEEVKFSVGR